MIKVELKRITVWRVGGITVIGKTELLDKPVPAPLIRTGPEPNQALREERPATNRLRHELCIKFGSNCKEQKMHLH
jgi:hypothetical protein